MKIVENIINECGISKVRVAKYLGVSRQMLYNYFAMDFKDVPKEKMNKIFKLFGVEGAFCKGFLAYMKYGYKNTNK